jgi:hypothetical protein
MSPPDPNLDANSGDEISINDAILRIFEVLKGSCTKYSLSVKHKHQDITIHPTFPLKLLLIQYTEYDGERTLRRLYTPFGEIRLLSSALEFSVVENITKDFDQNAVLCLQDVSRITPWLKPKSAAETLGEAQLYRVKGIGGKLLVGHSDEYSQLSTPVAARDRHEIDADWNQLTESWFKNNDY